MPPKCRGTRTCAPTSPLLGFGGFFCQLHFCRLELLLYAGDVGRIGVGLHAGVPLRECAFEMRGSEFQLAESPVRARAYICGLGYYELRINGRKVGDNVLDPA